MAKFSGLLLEARQMSRGRNAVAVGIGINCRSHPEGLAYPTTDLSTIAGRPIEPADVFVPLSVSLAKMLAVWNRGADFARVRAIWLDFAAGLGDVVRVVTGSRSIQGVFETIDVQGRLVLRTDRGPVTVDAGDVFLGPA